MPTAQQDLSATLVALLAAWLEDQGGAAVDPATVDGCLYCRDAATLAAFKTLLLADILVAIDPGADVTPQGLMSRAECVDCRPAYVNLQFQVEALEELLPDAEIAIGCFACRAEVLAAMEVQILQDILLTMDAGAEVTPDALAARIGCLWCRPETLGTINTMLLTEIVAGGGTSDSITTEDGDDITTEGGDPIEVEA